MGLGLLRELQQYNKLLDPSNRFVDFACQFHIFERSSNGDAIATGKQSDVIGGKWDVWLRQYAPEPPTEILHIPCSEKQFELIFCDKPRIEGNGGRGGGKSEGGVLWCIRNIAGLPNEHGEISAPTYRILRIDWFKLLAQLPRAWLFPGAQGINRGDKELHFVNGVVVRFCSADNPDALRSWGGSWAWVDEEQDVPDEPIDIIWPSLRLTSKPRMCTTGTPKPGFYYERHGRLLQNPNATCIRFDSYSNPFIPTEVFDLAKTQMDEATYRQEILAEWIQHGSLVYYAFDRSTHVQSVASAKQILSRRYGIYTGVGNEITSRVISQRFNSGGRFVIGMDFNISPMVAVVYRIFQAPPGVSDIWWGVDEVVLEDNADATRIAIELKRRGYFPSVIIPDASGKNSSGGRSSHRMLQDEGFNVFAPSRNPHIRDRVNAVNAKLLNKNSDITLFFDSKCATVIKAIQAHKLDPRTGKPEKDLEHEHRADAAGYPISYMCPVASISLINTNTPIIMAL